MSWNSKSRKEGINLADQSYSEQAIQSANSGMMAFCKFLSANDTGMTGGHQSGIYVAKTALRILFDEPGVRGSNKERLAKIRWQGDFMTDSRFIYYGTGTRNEYRITRFGRHFELLKEENTGALFVLVKEDIEDYAGWVLTTENDIDDFLGYFGMSPTDTGTIIGTPIKQPEDIKRERIQTFITSLGDDFPKAEIMSEAARTIYNFVYDHIENILKKPDNELICWINMEYELFRYIEEARYGSQIRQGFLSMQNFIDVANSVLNRRKSRAGKSLEYHLSALFTGNQLKYETQVITEEKKKPDFVFPGGAEYHDLNYDTNRLIVLGAKTTCKDRWRQVVTEADRVQTKYLCTLQQGISPQQLHEMGTEHIVLVVPRPYIITYPRQYRNSILDIATFIELVREKTQ